MIFRISDLRCREIIGLHGGQCWGFASDVEMDLETGQILGLVIPGKLRLFGLLGRTEDRVIPWHQVKRVGEDVVLIEEGNCASQGEKRPFFPARRD